MMMLMLRYITGENMKHWKLGIVAALLTGAAYAAPLPVVTSFSILGDVAKQIGGDRVAVQSLVGANQDSHAYHMTSGDIKKSAAQNWYCSTAWAWKPPMYNAQLNKAKCLSPKRPKAFRL